MHPLKWRYQAERRSSSWTGPLRGQRDEPSIVLADYRSPRRYPAQVLEKAHGSARLQATEDTGLVFAVFPEDPPSTIEDVLDPDFLPRHPDDPTA